MRLFLLALTLFCGAAFVFGLAAPALAAPPPQTTQQDATKNLLEGNLKKAGETGAGYSAKGRTNPLGIVTVIIKTAMSLLGLVFLGLTVYGGYLWMTAGGNETQVEKAKKTLSSGVIGLAIVLAGYIISINVLAALLKATGQTPAPLGPY